MRFLSFCVLLSVVVGCDQAAPELALSNAKTTEDDGEGEGSTPAFASETFWFGPDADFDAQFVLYSDQGLERTLTIEMLDEHGRPLATFEEARDHYLFVGGGDEQMAVSGPVAQSWPMRVCPLTSADEDPPADSPDCQVLAPNTGGGVQFLGTSTRNATSVHHKPGRTVYDYTNVSGGAAEFYTPDAMPPPGAQPDPDATYTHRPSVKYVLMSPVDAGADYVPHGVRMTWPRHGSTMIFDCSAVSHPGAGGTCPNAGSGRRPTF